MMIATDESIERYLTELDIILDNQFVDEVGITLDASLPPILYTGGKLGIAKNILKALFKHGLECIYRLKITERTSVDEYKEALSISRLVLLIKGDFPIAFDLRKKLIGMNALSIREEINFTSLLYTRHPKCPSGWHHRRWCLLSNLKSNNAVLSLAEVETERELCRVMAEKHPKNYYAWMHRLWVMKCMSMFQLEDELFFTKTWLLSHVSDHSAVNHRLQVIRHVLTLPDALHYIVNSDNRLPSSAEWFKFLEREFSESEELIRSRPGHEALWYLRRSLLEMLFVKASETETVRTSLKVLGKQSVSTVFLDELALTLTPADPITGPVDANEEVKPSSNAHTAFSHLTALTLIPSSIPGTQVSSAYQSSWLTSLLSCEMRLARKCVADTSAWDYPAQRAMATRYAAYLLDRTAHYTSDGAPGESSTQVAEKAEGDSRTDRDPTLTMVVSEALQHVCTILQSEDSFARIWNYKAGSTS